MERTKKCCDGAVRLAMCVELADVAIRPVVLHILAEEGICDMQATTDGPVFISDEVCNKYVKEYYESAMTLQELEGAIGWHSTEAAQKMMIANLLASDISPSLGKWITALKNGQSESIVDTSLSKWLAALKKG